MEPRLMSYLYYFNIAADYYECHEYGESLWLDTGRPQILKGLVQSAVCLYHLHNGNVRGGWKMWQRARHYIAPYRPVYASMDLDQLTVDIDQVYALVPTSLYPQVVPAQVIRDLNLPRVAIRIVDSEIRAALESWRPEPLDE